MLKRTEAGVKIIVLEQDAEIEIRSMLDPQKVQELERAIMANHFREKREADIIIGS